jgi:hypothetical protein
MDLTDEGLLADPDKQGGKGREEIGLEEMLFLPRA